MLAQDVYTQIWHLLERKFSLESDIQDMVHLPRTADSHVEDIGFVNPPEDWLPAPVDIASLNWVDKFSRLEAAPVREFGELIDEPVGF